MWDKINYWFTYYLIKTGMKLRLYVIDFTMEPNYIDSTPDVASFNCVAEGRWVWQKKAASSFTYKP